MALVPTGHIKTIDDARRAIQKLASNKIGPKASPTFYGLTLTTPLIVSSGGTGLATLTNHGILLGSGTGAITPLAEATDGQIPIGDTGADPVLATITGTTNRVTVSNAAGSITLTGPQDYHTGASPTFVGLTLSNITAENTDVDKFLVDSTGVIKYRTGTQVLSDIGGQTQGDVLDDLNTLGVNAADSEFLVGTGVGALAWESGAILKTSLGLTIGTDVQAYHANLASLAVLTYAAASFIKMTGANTFALRTIGETADDLQATIDHDLLANGGAHDYAYISGNDGDTNVTGVELEELTDSSETTLHSHAGGNGVNICDGGSSNVVLDVLILDAETIT